jgi:hypothetical protein
MSLNSSEIQKAYTGETIPLAKPAAPKLTRRAFGGRVLGTLALLATGGLAAREVLKTKPAALVEAEITDKEGYLNLRSFGKSSPGNPHGLVENENGTKVYDFEESSVVGKAEKGMKINAIPGADIVVKAADGSYYIYTPVVVGGKVAYVARYVENPNGEVTRPLLLSPSYQPQTSVASQVSLRDLQGNPTGQYTDGRSDYIWDPNRDSISRNIVPFGPHNSDLKVTAIVRSVSDGTSTNLIADGAPILNQRLGGPEHSGFLLDVVGAQNKGRDLAIERALGN